MSRHTPFTSALLALLLSGGALGLALAPAARAAAPAGVPSVSSPADGNAPTAPTVATHGDTPHDPLLT
ncbi:hypothetical protein OG552_11790 [Streptomyces sp. NBC_01476]|uniref:hypothetical protein n=1 Tax=Streptomyces sp. NBC_01476 TaxID=2903881 RepID=UPI002E2F7612|nr:hypothetical protein [Streptomyces sp. NBC_01476]